MLRLLAAFMVIGLAACATPTRTGPPAPIVSAPTQPPASAPSSRQGGTAAASKSEPVATYAYRVPSTIAETPAAEAPTVVSPPRSDAPRGLTATTRADSTPTPPVAYSPPPQVPDQAELPELPAAAEGLRRQAEQQRQARDYAGAAASLERALRISPQSAYLWNRLARVRLEQGMLSQAGNLAARSNALAGDQAKLKQDNWAVIGVSRRSAGDIAGANEADRLARGG